jgi:hypothetical protein
VSNTWWKITLGWRKLAWPYRATHISTHKKSLHYAINLQQKHKKKHQAHSWLFDISKLMTIPLIMKHVDVLASIKKKRLPIITTFNKKWFKHKKAQQVLSLSPWSWARHKKVPTLIKEIEMLIFKEYLQEFIKKEIQCEQTWNNPRDVLPLDKSYKLYLHHLHVFKCEGSPCL